MVSDNAELDEAKKNNRRGERSGKATKRQPRKSTKKRPARIIGMVAVIIVVLLVLTSVLAYYFYFMSDDDEDDGPDVTIKEVPIASAGGNRVVKSLDPVKFSGGSSYDPDGGELSYNWSFGDGSFSSMKNPTHVYLRPGNYQLTLTVIDDEGDASYDTAFITVQNRLPSVSAIVETEVIAYQVLKFNGTASDPDGIISMYEWDFNGDGKYDWYARTTGVTNYYYAEPGTFKAKLKVTDDNDGINTTEITIKVNPIPNNPPQANAGSNQRSGAGEISLFGTGTDPDDNIVKYEWDFDGDGTYDWSSNETGRTSHIFSTEGTFQARFRVTDEFGLQDTDTVNITIDNSIISASVGATVFIDWTSGFSYVITFNTSVDFKDLMVVITILPGDQEEKITSSGSMVWLDEYNVSVKSTMEPSISERLKVEVLYLGYLVGQRDLDLSNDLSRRFLNPNYDQMAEYSVKTDLHIKGTQTMRDENYTGISKITRNNRLVQKEYGGWGTMKLVSELEDSRAIFDLNSNSIYRNETWQDSELIQDSFDFRGTGNYKFTSVQGASFDVALDEFVLKEQDGTRIDYRFNGVGVYKNPPLEGKIKLDYDLLGLDIHVNWEGKAYTCEKYRIDTNIEYLINTTKFNFQNTTFIWVVADSETYENRTIYVEYIYRYSENDYVLTQVFGKYYPEDAPTFKTQINDILDTIEFWGISPVEIVKGDSFTLVSQSGLTMECQAVRGSAEVIDGDTYSTVILEGNVDSDGQGTTTMEVVNVGRYTGWMVSRSENYRWKEDTFRREISLIIK